MGLEINMRDDLMSLQTDMLAIQKKVLPQAIARTLNEVAGMTKTAIIKDISKDTGVKQKDIRNEGIFLSKRNRANKDKLYATITGRNKRFNMVRYLGAKQTKEGVKVKIGKQTKIYKGMFIVPVKYGKSREGSSMQVMKGKRDASGKRIYYKNGIHPSGRITIRSPIKKVYGPSMRDHMESPRIKRISESVYAHNFDRKFSHNLNFYETRAKK